MSVFKNLLKSDTSTDDNSTGLRGQGSHFRRDEDSQGATLTDSATTGPSERLGQSSVGHHDQPSLQGQGHKFPSTLRSHDESGTAAIGATSTYSSQPLASGDPTGSVVDHKSTDPLTYKLPEAGGRSNQVGSSAIPSNAASTAASLAWNKTDTMSGGYSSSGHENPYRTSNLDPRVDGGRRADPSSTGTQSRNSGLTSGISGNTSSGPGVASVDASHTANQPYARPEPSGSAGYTSEPYARPEPSGSAGYASEPSTQHMASAPSSLTNTPDPAYRSAEYGTSAGAYPEESTTTSTAGTHHGDSQEEQSYGSQILGGLTGAATAAAGYLGIGQTTETDEPRDTSAIATQPGQVSQESGPPKHYRRESIPTTAYPAGPNSPQAIAGPTGSSQGYGNQSGSTGHHLGRDTAVGAGAIGGGALGAHEYDRSRDLTSGDRDRNAPSNSGLGLGSSSSGVPHQQYSESQNLRGNITSPHTSHGYDLSSTDIPERTSSRDIGSANALESSGIPFRGNNRQSDMSSSGQPGEFSRRPISDDMAGGSMRNQPEMSTGDYSSNDRNRYTISNRDSPNEAITNAPGRFDGQDAYMPQSSTTTSGHHHGHHQHHSGRDAALGTGAGLGALAGGAEYAERDRFDDPLGRQTGGSSSITGSHGTPLTSGMPTISRDVVNAHDTPTYNAVTMDTGTLPGAIGASTGTSDRSYPTTGTTGSSYPATGADYSTGTTGIPHRSAGDSYPTTDTTGSSYPTSSMGSSYPTSSADTSRRDQGHHVGRDAALGAGAGAAAIGGAYAAHERSGHPASSTGMSYPTSGTSGTMDPSYQTTSNIGNTGSSYPAGGSLGMSDPRTEYEDIGRRSEGHHTGRDAALGAGAGTAVAGGAYAAHERYEQDPSRHAADYEKEREAHAKQTAKAEKQHEKDIKHAEKEHERDLKHHQKELAKEERHHEKELKHDEKERSAATIAAEKREHQRYAAEQEDRARREREAAAGIGAAGATGAGVAAYEEHKDPAHHEKEKKPSIFKRIFKSRKNKDTGEDEQYSTDEEEEQTGHHGSHVPVHHSGAKDRTVLGRAPETAGTSTYVRDNDGNQIGHGGAIGTGAAVGAGAGAGAGYGLTHGHNTTGEQGLPRDSVTGLPYDPSKDPEAAARLSGDPNAQGVRGTDGAPPGSLGTGTDHFGVIGDHSR